MTAKDAEILKQVQSSTLLWHKESLLNLALDFVPENVPHVAWLDCDVIFPMPPNDFIAALTAELQRHKIVQMFEELYDLGPEESLAPALPPPQATTRRGKSIASNLAQNNWQAGGVFPWSPFNSPRTSLSGIAWASHVDILRRHRLYDAMIAGSGVRALIAAACGEQEAVIDDLKFSPSRAEHFLSWAGPFHQTIQGDIGFLPNPALHLWHGDVAHRKYGERHEHLARLGFDPYTDLERDAAGLWRWRRPRPDLEKFFEDYFHGRQEDGPIPQLALCENQP